MIVIIVVIVTALARTAFLFNVTAITVIDDATFVVAVDAQGSTAILQDYPETDLGRFFAR